MIAEPSSDGALVLFSGGQDSAVCLAWALESGQPEAASLDYVPLPDALVQQIENYWKAQFTGYKG